MVDSVKIYEDTKRGLFASLHKLETKSENAKTGDMVGMYILGKNEKPTDSIKNKTDHIQCGDCPLRSGKVCYVNPVSVNAPWKKQHSQPVKDIPETFKKPVRLGVYGDPAFVPLDILEDVTTRAPRHTGYTHQWHRKSVKYAKYLMASIDGLMAKRQGLSSLELKRKANKKGYRTFRVVSEGDIIDSDEIPCPYEKGIQCADCGLCDGKKENDKRKNIYIYVHGANNKVKSYERAI